METQPLSASVPVETDEPSAPRSDEPPSCTAEEPLSCSLATLPAFALRSESPFDQLLAQRQTTHWQDWRWQMRRRIHSVGRLLDYFPELRSQVGLADAATKFPLAITPYYASLIRTLDNSDPVFQMAVPQIQELYDPPFLRNDPLEEDSDMPVPGLVHRYADRALVLATTTCAMYCRHCTRKRIAGSRDFTISNEHLAGITDYLKRHPEIHDVIVSGGDPFTMATPALERILEAIRQVPTVDIIRIGTRTPVVLPMRITGELVRMLRKYQPVWVNTHFNHPAELTPDAIEAVGRLADAGIPVGNQAVLLRGINDHPKIMEQLLRGLVRARVRPYYLFQCDLVRGVEHFRTPISRGIEIMEYLRGRLSGLAIPTYVVDAPHGGGKIPVLPNYVVSSSPTHTVLRNFEGMLVNYPEPRAHYVGAPDPTPGEEPATAGVWGLAAGHGTVITPSGSCREERRDRPQVEQNGHSAVDAFLSEQ
ncbi:MAG: KamA family radical SAM protein [Lentisphaeria bacterium]